MTFAPEPVVLTRIQRQVLIDLDRMAMELDSDGMHETLAILIADHHHPTNPIGLLKELTRKKYLRHHKTSSTLTLTDKPIPPALTCQIGDKPMKLADSFFKTILSTWKKGNRNVETYFTEPNALNDESASLTQTQAQALLDS